MLLYLLGNADGSTLPINRASGGPMRQVCTEWTAHETPCHSRAAERSLLKRLLKVLPLVVLPVLFGGFTEQQIEEARVTTHQNLERFRACLMKEGQIMLDQNDQKWSVEDASDYFKSACIPATIQIAVRPMHWAAYHQKLAASAYRAIQHIIQAGTFKV